MTLKIIKHIKTESEELSTDFTRGFPTIGRLETWLLNNDMDFTFTENATKSEATLKLNASNEKCTIWYTVTGYNRTGFRF